MMNERRQDPLSYVDKCFMEMGVHSGKVQLCAMSDVKVCFEALQYL